MLWSATPAHDVCSMVAVPSVGDTSETQQAASMTISAAELFSCVVNALNYKSLAHFPVF